MRSTISVLVVDDHGATRLTLKDILEGEGYEVSAVGQGQDAVQQCHQQKFDVILMDVRMPDLNGVEVYRRIKQILPEVRVIMMSAYSNETVKRAALHEGAVAFLQKPLDVELVLDLVEQIKRVL